MKPYVQYKADGSIWRAGKSIYGLCAAYNHATSPSKLMTEEEHKRSFAYARAILGRIRRLKYRDGEHYCEWSNGSLWPIAKKNTNS